MPKTPKPPRQKRPRPPDQRPPRRFGRGWIFWLLILGLVAIFWHLSSDTMTDARSVGLTTFKKHIVEGHVKKITIKSDYWEARLRKPEEGEPYPMREDADILVIRYETPYEADSVEAKQIFGAVETFNHKVERAREAETVEGTELEKYRAYQPLDPINDTASSKLWTLFLTILPFILIFGLMYFFFFRHMRSPGGQSILSFGKSRARLSQKETVNVTFDDVAGIEEAKEEVQEIVQFLKNPDRFRRLGGRLPHGVLLVGPPGSGKTLLAKAIAGEADTPFYSISGSDFVEMFVGVGASRVRDLFQQAKGSSPCIIFLDEIDAVGRQRGTGLGGGHDEREQTLNAILVEMDGFETDEAVIVIAATNRPDVLDPALRRPGRFDRQIIVDLPDIKGREGILKVHSKEIKLGDEEDLKTIARSTPSFSGADLENLINEAAILATMRDHDAVELADLEDARDRVVWGRERRSRVIDERERRVIAFHEAGHAIVAHLDPDHEPLHKVGIIPRGMALGATMHLPEKDTYMLGRRKAIATIATLMAGRVSEQLFCDDIHTGAADDIRRATDVARRMVTQWGMSDELGPIVYGDVEEHLFLGREVSRHEQISAEIARKIDKEIRRIIDDATKNARQYLTDNAPAVKAVVEELLKREVLTAEEVDAIIRGEELPEPDLPASPAPAETAEPEPAADTQPEPAEPKTDAADQEPGYSPAK
ncbi:MAG: ATP-dependent zinc metalloprotease FtsH [bacterium]